MLDTGQCWIKDSGGYIKVVDTGQFRIQDSFGYREVMVTMNFEFNKMLVTGKCWK